MTSGAPGQAARHSDQGYRFSSFDLRRLLRRPKGTPRKRTKKPHVAVEEAPRSRTGPAARVAGPRLGGYLAPTLQNLKAPKMLSLEA
jgi:hypothetical protein